MRTLVVLATLAFIPVCAQPSTVDLFVIAGQSNAAGRGDATLAPRPAEDTAFWIDVQEGEPVYTPVGSDRARDGSLGPAFAETYHDLTGRTVLLLTVAVGNTANTPGADRGNGHWSALSDAPGVAGGPALLPGALDTIRRASALTGLPVAGVIWAQGEGDAAWLNNDRITLDDYRRELTGTVDAFQATLAELGGGRFGIVQTGRLTSADVAGYQGVRRAQASLAAEGRAIVLTDQAVTFPARGWMKDNVHYSQAGLDFVGREAAAVFAGASAPVRFEDEAELLPPTVLGNPGRSYARFARPVTGAVVDSLGRRVATLDRADRTPTLPAGAYTLTTVNGPVRFTVVQ